MDDIIRFSFAYTVRNHSEEALAFLLLAAKAHVHLVKQVVLADEYDLLQLLEMPVLLNLLAVIRPDQPVLSKVLMGLSGLISDQRPKSDEFIRSVNKFLVHCLSMSPLPLDPLLWSNILFSVLISSVLKR